MTPARTLPTVLDLAAPPADRAIVVGDPGRALTVAQLLLERPPRMTNHRRGLWGYTGTASDGAPLTVQSTGVGAASAVPVVRELAAAGVTRMVRAGSALPLGPVTSAAPVPLVTVTAAVARDGASRALGVADGARLLPDPALTAALRSGTADAVRVVGVDLLPQDGGRPPDVDDGDAVDRQTAAFLAAAGRWNVTAAAVLALPPAVEDEAARERWWHELGAAAGRAFGLTAQPPVPAATTPRP